MSYTFDVFLSHNSQDKPAVRELASALKGRSLSVWLDEEQLTPGESWQDLLEQGIRASSSVAVLIGGDGLGPWEKEEMKAALSFAVSSKDKSRVFPVLLPGAPHQPDLPMFLTNRTWVDLRSGFTDQGLDNVVWGVTGVKPKISATPVTESNDPSPTQQRDQQAFENKIRAVIAESLLQPHLAAWVDALAKRLPCVFDVAATQESHMAALVDVWWKDYTPLDRIATVLHEATETCLKQNARSGAGAEFGKIAEAARQVLAWLALACMSQAWLNRHRNAHNPYHDVPLRFVTSIELYAACLKEDLSAGLRKPATPGDVVGKGLAALDEHGFFPETGWQPQTAVEQAARALYKSEHQDEKTGAFTQEDYSKLAFRLRKKGKYIAVNKELAATHPLLLPEVCALFKQRLPGVGIIHFGIVTVQGDDRPLIVDEGQLVGAIELFLEMIEPYENS
ncbi:MAG: toll/interleukin-1 receptor domain-containing protein [Methylococcaceae bacterium]|nr:MAG: toll/interleukin-1 receptor domain-containing protein [Methylococcaceae bacterium]